MIFVYTSTWIDGHTVRLVTPRALMRSELRELSWVFDRLRDWHGRS